MSDVRLASGQTKAQDAKDRYETAAQRRAALSLPARRLRSFFMGGSGQGKTHFLLTRPRTLIINFDSSPASGDVAEGTTLWPGPGAPIGWPDVARKMAEVVKQAAAGRCPYDGVALDSYNGMLGFAHQYAAYVQYEKRVQKNKGTPMPLAEFGPIEILDEDGRRTWPLAYQLINRMLDLPFRAGLGVALAIHTKRVEIAQENGPTITKIEPDINANQYSYLRPVPDIIMYLEGETQMRAEYVDVPGPGGRSRKERREVQAYKQRLFSEHAQLQFFLKARSYRPLPAEIDVTETGWAAYEAAVDAANN